MLLLRFLFKSVFLWLLARILGRFLPIFKRILSMMR